MHVHKSRVNTTYSVGLGAFWWNDPKWPQIDIWLNSIDKESQADAPVWDLWSCYVISTWYSNFSENDLLTPVTPNVPGWIFMTITFVEGIKLMHMHKSRVHTTYFVGLHAVLVKMTFLTQVTFEPFRWGRMGRTSLTVLKLWLFSSRWHH